MKSRSENWAPTPIQNPSVYVHECSRIFHSSISFQSWSLLSWVKWRSTNEGGRLNRKSSSSRLSLAIHQLPSLIKKTILSSLTVPIMYFSCFKYLRFCGFHVWIVLFSVYSSSSSRRLHIDFLHLFVEFRSSEQYLPRRSDWTLYSTLVHLLHSVPQSALHFISHFALHSVPHFYCTLLHTVPHFLLHSVPHSIALYTSLCTALSCTMYLTLLHPIVHFVRHFILCCFTMILCNVALC